MLQVTRLLHSVSLSALGAVLTVACGSAQVAAETSGQDGPQALVWTLEMRNNIMGRIPVVIVCDRAFPFGNKESDALERRLRRTADSLVIDTACDEAKAAGAYFKKPTRVLYVKGVDVSPDSVLVKAAGWWGAVNWNESAPFSRKPRLRGGKIVLSDVSIP